MSATDDIVAIQQLLARYNTAVDAGDGQAFAATFTVDGVSINGESRVTGREALAAIPAQVATTVPGLRHWVANHVIDLDGDEATATVYLLALRGGTPSSLLTSGRYVDRLRRTPDGWRFAVREFLADT
jgi:ketosteroid isomerase-like protein